MSLQNPGALRLRWTDALLDNLDQGDTRGLALLDHLAHPDRQRAIERRIIAADSSATALSLAHSMAERGMTPSSRVIERLLSAEYTFHSRAQLLFACAAYPADVRDHIDGFPIEAVRDLLLMSERLRQPVRDDHRTWLYERSLVRRFERNGQRDSMLIASTLDFESSQSAFDAELDAYCLPHVPDLPESRAWLQTQPALVERALAELNAPHWLFVEQPVAERERIVADALASGHAPSFGRAIPSLLRLPNAARLCDEALANESVRHRRLTLSGARIRFDPPCDFPGLERDGVFSAFVGSFGGSSTNPSGSEAFTLWALDQDTYFRDAFISRAERGHSLRPEDIARAAKGDELLQTALLRLQAKDSADAAEKLEVRARGAEHVILRSEALRALRSADPRRAARVAIERIASDVEEVEYYAPFMTEAAVCLTPENAAGLDGEACLAALIEAYTLAPSNDAMDIIDFAIAAWFGDGPTGCGRPWTRYWRAS